MGNKERCCGACCWFRFEDTDGWGECPHQDLPDVMNCADMCTTDQFISKEDMRHYVAVLRQANRYRRDDNVPSIYKMPNPTELGKAIDFACEYIKTNSEV